MNINEQEDWMAPPNRAGKRHLRVSTGGARRVRAACGAVNPVLYTRDATQVTCGACRRTLAMADAEILSRRAERRRGSD